MKGLFCYHSERHFYKKGEAFDFSSGPAAAAEITVNRLFQDSEDIFNGILFGTGGIQAVADGNGQTLCEQEFTALIQVNARHAEGHRTSLSGAGNVLLACDDILLPVAVHIAEGDEIYFGGKQPVIIGVREGVYGIAVRDKGIFHTGTPVFRDFAGGELYIFVTAQADSEKVWDSMTFASAPPSWPSKEASVPSEG